MPPPQKCLTAAWRSHSETHDFVSPPHDGFTLVFDSKTGAAVPTKRTAPAWSRYIVRMTTNSICIVGKRYDEELSLKA